MKTQKARRNAGLFAGVMEEVYGSLAVFYDAVDEVIAWHLFTVR
jgi:hypothetical protein